MASNKPDSDGTSSSESEIDDKNDTLVFFLFWACWTWLAILFWLPCTTVYMNPLNDVFTIHKNKMRKELSEVPFEDLHKLQERVGSKVYDKALFGSEGKTNASSGEQDTRRKKFKRANKNRPQEVSSKVQVPRFRNVVEVKQKVSRDPRFDDLSGKVNEAAFESNYFFMQDVYDREKKAVKDELKRAKTEQQQNKLHRLLQRLEQQEKERGKKQMEKETSTEHKKREKELVKQGKKPFFLKKSEMKNEKLAQHYKQLKQTGKLSKYLTKKRRKNASKDRKQLPGMQREIK